ncbi:GreA/GreB family elongation factor [Flavobacterium crassostreae]|uniref:GreA/GreB family elongation factor n=1 Tax=Flavobacterium crassostreae TaxID=1763534 RepID=UPI0008A5F1AF|nr:GreA/GreB family elongation factor [Flavobacterium crassostreae]
MKYGQLIVDEKEYSLLMQTIASTRSQEDKIYRDSLKKLKLELLTAKQISYDAMPQDVIRFNSVVRISTPFNVERSYQIVTPEKSNIQQNKISILSPMALALFGYAKGDKITWQFPSGTNVIEIMEVTQQSNLLKKESV